MGSDERYDGPEENATEFRIKQTEPQRAESAPKAPAAGPETLQAMELYDNEELKDYLLKSN